MKCRRRACACSTRKLQWLAEHAHFDININSVVGGGIKNPEDARTINQPGTRARVLDLDRHHPRRLRHPEAARRRRARGVRRRDAADQRTKQVFKNLYSGIRSFQANLADGKPNDWSCRAGARYLYICENGLVHWCSQQRGFPGVPLAGYSIEDIRRELLAPKWCAPLCTIGCVHRVSRMDFWRKPQKQEPGRSAGLRQRSVLIHAWPTPFRSISRPASTSRKSTTLSTRRGRKWRSATTSRARARPSISIAKRTR